MEVECPYCGQMIDINWCVSVGIRPKPPDSYAGTLGTISFHARRSARKGQSTQRTPDPPPDYDVQRGRKP